MNIKHFLIAVLLGLSLPAAAEFTTVAEAYELALSDFRVPATPSSGVIFKKCGDCDMMTLRVTPNTDYRVNGKSYPLKEFRKRVFDIRDRANTPVIVLHHLEADIVLSVSVTY
jgi:hypothetical protein